MKMVKETLIEGQCQEVEACLRKYTTKKTYQLVKNLTTESITIQDKSGKYLTEEQEIVNRSIEYCSDLYNYDFDGNPTSPDCPPITGEEHRTE